MTGKTAHLHILWPVQKQQKGLQTPVRGQRGSETSCHDLVHSHLMKMLGEMLVFITLYFYN